MEKDSGVWRKQTEQAREQWSFHHFSGSALSFGTDFPQRRVWPERYKLKSILSSPNCFRSWCLLHSNRNLRRMDYWRWTFSCYYSLSNSVEQLLHGTYIRWWFRKGFPYGRRWEYIACINTIPFYISNLSTCWLCVCWASWCQSQE